MNRVLARSALGALALVGASSALLASAQGFPAAPIRIIVPSVAGGVLDGLVRVVAQQVAAAIGEPVVVENRPGGNSVTAMVACAKAAPDGYTLCAAAADALSYNPHLFAELPYDPDRDLTPVIQLTTIQGVIVARADAPFGSISEMVAFAKAQPGVLNWATLGPGSISRVYLAWIRHQTDADITDIPYKGVAQAVPALLAGEVHLHYVGLGFVLNQIQAGKLKPLAVTGRRRSPILPEVPALEETVGDPALTSYFGVLAPAKTSRPIVDRLNAEFATALRTPRVREFLTAQTLEAAGNSPTEFAEFLHADQANAGRILRTIGVVTRTARP